MANKRAAQAWRGASRPTGDRAPAGPARPETVGLRRSRGGSVDGSKTPCRMADEVPEQTPRPRCRAREHGARSSRSPRQGRRPVSCRSEVSGMPDTRAPRYSGAPRRGAASVGLRGEIDSELVAERGGRVLVVRAPDPRCRQSTEGSLSPRPQPRSRAPSPRRRAGSRPGRLLSARHRGRRAAAAGVSGGVRNRPDGYVEAVFEGERDAVERLVGFAQKARAVLAGLGRHLERGTGRARLVEIR